MAKRTHLKLDPRKNYRLPEELIDGYDLYVKLRGGEKRADRKVTLIGRPLPNGNVSLYRYAFVDGKKKQEATGAILVPEYRTEDKVNNKRVLDAQREICAELAVKLKDGNATFNPKSRTHTKALLADYCESLREVFKPSFRLHLQGLAKHLRIYNASLRVAEVDDEVIKDFIAYLNNRAVSLNWTKNPDKAPRLAENTKADLVSMLSMVLNEAVRKHILSSNPCYLIPRGQRPQHDNNRRTYLAPVEVAKLMQTPYPCNENKKDYKQDTPSAFFFSVFSGLRFSDVTALTEKNIGEDENGVYIHFKAEKTGKEQTLYLNELALQYLPRHNKENGRLFDIPGNKQTNTDLAKWCEKAGISKKVTFHVARHTTATMELNAGVPLEVVSNQLGHSDTRITQVYAKILNSTQRKATDKMAQFFKEQTAR